MTGPDRARPPVCVQDKSPNKKPRGGGLEQEARPGVRREETDESIEQLAWAPRQFEAEIALRDDRIEAIRRLLHQMSMCMGWRLASRFRESPTQSVSQGRGDGSSYIGVSACLKPCLAPRGGSSCRRGARALRRHFERSSNQSSTSGPIPQSQTDFRLSGGTRITDGSILAR